jgi:HEAT repeat protein
MNRFASFFKVHQGESGLVGLLFALMFFPSFGGAIGSPGIESLFYTRFGVEYLPYMYMVLGVTIFMITLFITSVLERLSRKVFYQILPIFLAFALAMSRILVGFKLNWFYPFLWLGMYILWTFQILLIWGTASMVCDTRQAKRLFPLFGAGGILGIALGGVVTKTLVSWMSTENLVLIWAGTLVIGFVLIRHLVKNSKEKWKNRAHTRTPMTNGFTRGYQYVRSSRLLRRISLTAMLLGLLYFMITFPFSKAAAMQFPNEEILAGFLGLFNGLATAAALVISLLLANRVYARFGFMAAIWIYSIIYLVGFAALSIFPIFSMLITFRFLQLSWMEGISSTAYQAVFNIVPSERREQSRLFINGVPRQIGVTLAGLLLMMSQKELQTRLMFFIGIAFAAVALIIIWLAKKSYLGALVEALRTGQPSIFYAEEEPFGIFRRDAAAVSTALAGISDSDTRVRRIAAEILGNLPLPDTIDALVIALDDPDFEVREATLLSLEKTNAAQALFEISSCLEDPVPEVRLQAVKTLARLAAYPKGLIIHLQPLLDDTDTKVRSTAASTILSLESHEKASHILSEMICSGDVEKQIPALEAVAEFGGRISYDLAANYLHDTDAAVRRNALMAVSRLDHQRSLDSLIQALGDEDSLVVETAVAEVGKARPEAFKRLIGSLNDPALESGALRALESLPSFQEAESFRRYARTKVAKMTHYGELGWKAEQQNQDMGHYGLLRESLRDYARTQGIYALRAVGLIEGTDTVALAIEGLNSEDTEQKANALEMLDSIGEREIVDQVLKSWEITSKASEQKKEPDGQAQSSWMLPILQDQSAWLRACAVLAVTDPDEPQIRDALQHLKDDPDPLVHEAVLKVFKGGLKMKTLSTLSLIECIIFLKRVPLFSRLPPAELKQIAAICVEQDFLDGDFIGRQGEQGEDMYIIVSGEVRVVKGGEHEKGGVELARRRAGEYIGEMAIISNEPRMASLIATGNVHTLRISQKQFEQILRQRPETSLAVMRVLCARLREVQKS